MFRISLNDRDARSATFQGRDLTAGGAELAQKVAMSRRAGVAKDVFGYITDASTLPNYWLAAR